MSTRSETGYSSYMESLFGHEDRFKQEARQHAAEINAGHMCLSPAEGLLLAGVVKHALAAGRGMGKAKIFVAEIGTLTGLSTQYLYEALPNDSELWTFELQVKQAKFAQEVLRRKMCHELVQATGGKETQLMEKINPLNLKSGDFDLSFIEVAGNRTVYSIVGDAKLSLASVTEHLGESRFDLVFIDANKADYGAYLDWAEVALRPGGCLIADNCFLKGDVFTANSSQDGQFFGAKQIASLRAFNHRLSDQKKFSTYFLPTSEGMAVAVKRDSQ